MNIQSLKNSFIAMLAIALLFSCKKDEESPMEEIPVMNIELYSGSTISTTVTGRITTEDGSILPGAVVTVGLNSTTSDEYGVYQLNNISVDSKRAYVHVSANGYFNSGAIIDPEEGEISMADIQLMDKTIAGTLDDASGGTINFDGISVSFPANAVSYENGAEYTGAFNVSMRSLSQSPGLAARLMPGDLAALNESQELGALTSYSMIVVELESSTGDALQITEGVQADVSFPVPAWAQGNAPSTIALWHFDETEGIWKEDGEATLVGNQYEGAVSHFSWWNCDAFGDDSYLTVCLTTNEGLLPAVGAYATISLQGGLSGSGFTGVDGCFSTYIPAGQTMILSVADGCNEELLTTTIGPFGTNSTPDISLNIDVATTTITGTIVDCNNLPESGIIYLSTESTINPGQNTFLSLDEVGPNGDFVFQVYNCPTGITEINMSTNGIYYTIPANYTITPGEVNDIGQLTTCGAEYEYFIQNINGSVSNNDFSDIYGYSLDDWYVYGETYFVFENIGMAGTCAIMDTVGGPDGYLYDWNNGLQYLMEASDFTVEVTAYPQSVTDYIEGTVTGQVDDVEEPGTMIPVTIDFRLQVGE